MKLMLCVKCNEVFSLSSRGTKECAGGHCGGQYEDTLNATVWGDPEDYFVLGFANSSFVHALREQKEHGDHTIMMGGIYGNTPAGRDFSAFVIPVAAPTVKRLPKKPVVKTKDKNGSHPK